MSFHDQPFENSPSRNTESASNSQTSVEERPEVQSTEVQSEAATKPLATSHQSSASLSRSAKENNMEDFATVLENFEAAQTEALAAIEHKVITGTVVKLTSKHAVIDIGAKSEGLLPIAEIQDKD